MKTSSRMALVLGITGGIGGEVARTLLARGADMADAVCRAAGISTRKIHAFPWWCVRLRAFIGTEPHTPLEEAVARSHAWTAGNTLPRMA
jgi:NAD(P)-dependent dehydrogenase (short-subunit alcohol dehydrogenase family)